MKGKCNKLHLILIKTSTKMILKMAYRNSISSQSQKRRTRCGCHLAATDATDLCCQPFCFGRLPATSARPPIGCRLPTPRPHQFKLYTFVSSLYFLPTCYSLCPPLDSDTLKSILRWVRETRVRIINELYTVLFGRRVCY